MKTPPRLVGLTGTNGAGKGAAAAFFMSKGYAYLSLSDILREVLRGLRLEETRDNLIRAGNELRERYGADVLAKRTLERVQGPTVIDSIRNLAEVEHFRGRAGDDFILLAIDAPVEVRYARVARRGRDESAGSLEEFRRKEAEELAGGAGAQQLEACMDAADRLIMNNGTLEELRAKLEAFL